MLKTYYHVIEFYGTFSSVIYSFQDKKIAEKVVRQLLEESDNRNYAITMSRTNAKSKDTTEQA